MTSLEMDFNRELANIPKPSRNFLGIKRDEHKNGLEISEKDTVKHELPLENAAITGPAEEGVSRTGEESQMTNPAEHEYNKVLHTIGKVMFLTGESPTLLVRHLINLPNENDNLVHESNRLYVNKEFVVS